MWIEDADAVLPAGGEPGSKESKERAGAWRALNMKYQRAVKASAAAADDAEAPRAKHRFDKIKKICLHASTKF